MHNDNNTIIIADDHSLFAEGLIPILKAHFNFAIFIHITRGDLLLLEITKINPILILLDIKMPGMDGINILRSISFSHPETKVIMLSTYSEPEIINQCINLGADAFLLKNAHVPELIETVQRVLNNKGRVKIAAANTKNQNFNYLSNVYKITHREWEILNLLKTGETNQQISDRLNLSVYTVATHRKNIMQKLSLRSPAELFRFLYEMNL